MAQSIGRVKLEIDGRQYIAEIKRAEDATKGFGNTAEKELSRVDRVFRGLDGGINNLHNRMLGLKTAVAAVGFGILARNALDFASSLKDLSDSSGIAVENLLNFSNALATSGGQADKLPEIIAKFSQTVEDAASNAGKSLYAFEKLGIGLETIGRLDTQELLKKTLEGLARMPPGVERSARMMDLFGKSFRSVDPKELLAKLNAAGTSSSQYADNIKRAGELSDQLSLASQKLSTALIVAFGPAIEKISAFAEKINSSEEAMQDLIATVKIASAVLVTAFSATALLTFVRVIGTVGRGVAAAGVALGVFGKAAMAIFAPMGKILVIGRAIALLASVGFGIYAASELFDNFGDIASNAFSRILESILAFGADIIDLVYIPINKVIQLLNKIPGVDIKGLDDSNNFLRGMQKNLEASRLKTEELARAQKKISIKKPGAAASDAGVDTSVPGVDDAAANGADISGAQQILASQRASIEKITEAYKKANEEARAKIATETLSVGLSQQQREIEQARLDLQNKTSAAIDQLTERKSQLKKEDERLIPVIDAQIAAIEKQGKADEAALVKAIAGRQAREAADRLAQQGARGAAELEQLKAQMLGYSLTALEKFNQAQAQGDFRDKTQAEIDLLKQQAEQIDELTAKLTTLQITRQTESQLLELQTSIMGRQFSAVEKLEQLKAQNPELYARKTQEENAALLAQAQAIDATTEKLKGYAFARDLLRQSEDFAQSIRDQMALDTTYSEGKKRALQVEIDLNNQLKDKIREIQDAYGDEASLSDEARAARARAIDEATKGFAKLKAEQTKIVQDDQARRESFGFGWDEALGRYVEASKNAAEQAKTYFDTFTKGVEDAIVGFVKTGKLNFKDLANSLIEEFTRIQVRRLLAGILGGSSGSSVGSFFDAITGRAVGGPVAANTPYVVGEKGPELFMPRSAGSIIPNHQLSMSQPQTTNVVYQIQAVDAMSFRQMVARDPEFIYAVTEKGRSAVPSRR